MGQRREVIIGMSEDTVRWLSDSRECVILPVAEKVDRKHSVISLNDLVKLIVMLQQVVIRKLLLKDKQVTALWINPHSGGAMTPEEMTRTVKETIQSVLPNSNITPADFPRYIIIPLYLYFIIFIKIIIQFFLQILGFFYCFEEN